ncbi:MarR family winged helix-turn-helix transcriptional regulator [Ponticaulis sp.]|uniref:MarR family winged helix-turn-helix transcriptional regulator n=1 Tax=Ponticaulis sp. TaxID=2020902 RepID=UPI000B6D9944|nr:MarR family transcriptional regulator [Ponticaulis sp.]MAI90062.1 MarR family transcriptional regulator [Ponticaulis sp.]OUX99718.1 MAG: MarR family transcriptional regulator [Hyphomonadaceae bacterium TMED5]|tara:strand:- start:17329 stop:17814 length:486 start_codon:yes stop_codon:yes gene_type:complete
MSNHYDVLIALRQITRAIDVHSKKMVREIGLTSPQLLVLKEIEQNPTIKASTIAKEVHLSQATVTTIIDRLQKAGLIVRARSDSDKRVVNLALTDGGRARIENAPDLLQAGFVEKFKSLEEWERLQLVSSLQRVAAMMNAEDFDAAPILEIGDLHMETETA